jgi:hypothetical protein
VYHDGCRLFALEGNVDAPAAASIRGALVRIVQSDRLSAGAKLAALPPLARFGKSAKEVVPNVVDLLNRTDVSDQQIAAIDFLQTYQPAGIDADNAVVSAFVRGDAPARRHCSMYILSQPDHAQRLLEPLLTNPSTAVREATLETSGSINPTDSTFIAKVSRLTRDTDASVRRASWNAQANWLNRSDAPPLTAALRNTPPAFDLAAQDALTASLSDEIKNKLGMASPSAQTNSTAAAGSSLNSSHAAKSSVLPTRWLVILPAILLLVAASLAAILIRSIASRAKQHVDQELAHKCDRCRAKIPLNSRFCRRCGLRIGS